MISYHVLLSVYDKDHMSELQIKNISIAVSWVRIPLEPQIFFWAFFVTALVTSQLRGSLSLLCIMSYDLHVTSALEDSMGTPLSDAVILVL